MQRYILDILILSAKNIFPRQCRDTLETDISEMKTTHFFLNSNHFFLKILIKV